MAGAPPPPHPRAPPHGVGEAARRTAAGASRPCPLPRRARRGAGGNPRPWFLPLLARPKFFVFSGARRAPLPRRAFILVYRFCAPLFASAAAPRTASLSPAYGGTRRAGLRAEQADNGAENAKTRPLAVFGGSAWRPALYPPLGFAFRRVSRPALPKGRAGERLRAKARAYFSAGAQKKPITFPRTRDVVTLFSSFRRCRSTTTVVRLSLSALPRVLILLRRMLSRLRRDGGGVWRPGPPRPPAGSWTRPLASFPAVGRSPAARLPPSPALAGGRRRHTMCRTVGADGATLPRRHRLPTRCCAAPPALGRAGTAATSGGRSYRGDVGGFSSEPLRSTLPRDVQRRASDNFPPTTKCFSSDLYFTKAR